MKGTVIWKFPLGITDVQTVCMPCNAQVLSVGNQGGALCLWALVDSKEPKVWRQFRIIGTGSPIEESLGRFIGTVLVPPFVWHVFEEPAG